MPETRDNNNKDIAKNNIATVDGGGISIEAEDKLLDQMAHAFASIARQLYVIEKRND